MIKHKQHGITLVESLITVIIISTVFISITRLQLGMWKTSKDTQLIEIANSLAYAKMDDITTQLAYSSLPPENGSTEETQRNISFNTTWETTSLKSGATTILVDVTWQSKTIHIETIQHPVTRLMRGLLTTQK